MTVALAAVAAVLAVALVTAIVRSAQTARRYAEQHAALAAHHDALMSEVAATREALDLLERQMTTGRSLTETAEHLRLQREWGELAGPGADLPAAWDASLSCVVASELEIIREVVGTPSTVDAVSGDNSTQGFRLALAAEFLRAAARDADEMHVEVGDHLVVRGSSPGSGPAASTPHLNAIGVLVEDGSAEVIVEVAERGFTAKLVFRD